MLINIDYKQPISKQGELRLSNSEITQNYIQYAVLQTYKDGLEGQLRRILGRIQRKLDEAIENKKDEIELEQAEIDFIKKSFKDIKTPVELSKYFVLLEDEVEKL